MELSNGRELSPALVIHVLLFELRDAILQITEVFDGGLVNVSMFHLFLSLFNQSYLLLVSVRDVKTYL